MLLGGLWHGANWTFVAWGGLHGAALAVNHVWQGSGLRLPRPAAWTLTLLFVMACWVLFRSPDFFTAGDMLLSMVGQHGAGEVSLDREFIVALIAGAAVALLGPTSQGFALRRLQPRAWLAMPVGAALAYLLLLVGGRLPMSSSTSSSDTSSRTAPLLPPCRRTAVGSRDRIRLRRLVDLFAAAVATGQPRPGGDQRTLRFPALARSDRFDSAVFGTSTSRLLRPVVLNAAFGARFVNLAMNAATAYEQTRLMAVFRRAHPEAHQVLVGLDLAYCRPGLPELKFTPRPFPAWMY
jgi:hypothetical protein